MGATQVARRGVVAKPTAPASVAQLIAASSPRRWYKFNEAAGSVVDHGSDATAASAWNITPTRHVAGGDLNDVDNFGVTLTVVESGLTPAALALPASHSWEAMIRPPAGGGANYAILVNRDWGNGNGQRIERLALDGGGWIEAYGFPAGSVTGNKYLISSTGVFPASTWGHVALTFEYDGANTVIRLYANGVLVDTDTMVGSVLTTSNPWYIARSTNNSGAATFIGSLQHLACYDYTMSASNILKRAVAMGLA